MPAFRIRQLNGTFFSSTQLRKGLPTVLVIFSPVCQHCEQVLNELKTRTADFKGAQFVFILEERQKPYLKDFLARTQLQQHSFFRNLGTDASNLIYDIYTYQALPQVNVYNRQGRLVHTFTSTIPLDSVQALIR